MTSRWPTPTSYEHDHQIQTGYIIQRGRTTVDLCVHIMTNCGAEDPRKPRKATKSSSAGRKFPAKNKTASKWPAPASEEHDHQIQNMITRATWTNYL